MKQTRAGATMTKRVGTFLKSATGWNIKDYIPVGNDAYYRYLYYGDKSLASSVRYLKD